MPSPSSLPRTLYSFGDPVLFTYIRGTRKVVIPVVISSVGMKVYKYRDGEPIEVDALSYRVSSGRGGELRVSPSELRPDTILDRITVALDAAE